MGNSNKKIKIIIIIFCLILVIASGVYVVLGTDLFKSEEQLFKKYMFSTTKELKSFCELKPYSYAIKKMEKDPIEINFNLKTKTITEDDFEDEESESFVNTDLALKFDKKNKNLEYNMDIKHDNSCFLSTNLVFTDKAYSFQIEGIHDKYLTIENREFRKLSQNLGLSEDMVDNVPDNLSNMEFSDIEKKKLIQIATKYMQEFFEDINDNNFIKENYEIDDFNNRKYKGNKYSLELSSKELEQEFQKIYKELMADQNFLNIIEKRIPAKTLEKLKENSEKTNDDSAENVKDKKIKISVYESEGKTIRIELAEDDEVMVEFSILNDGDNNVIKIRKVSPKSDLVTVASENIIEVTNKFEENSGELNINIKKSYDKKDVEKAIKQSQDSMFGGSDYIKERYKNKSTNIQITSSFENDKTISGTVKTDDSNSKDTNSFNIKYGSDVKFTELSKDNSIVLNDYSEEELQTLLQDIIANMGEYAENNPNSMLGMRMSRYTNFYDDSDYDDDYSFNYDEDDDYDDDEDDYYDNLVVTPSDYSPYADETTEMEIDKFVVNETIAEAIRENLKNYHEDYEYDQNVNPADYLTIEEIKNKTTLDNNMELINGNIIKTTFDGYTYFTQIYIDAENWELIETETLYSEDGTLENAR